MYEDAMMYFFFAERWKWRPSEVDDEPQWLIDRLPGVAQMYDEVQADKQRAAAESEKT